MILTGTEKIFDKIQLSFLICKTRNAKLFPNMKSIATRNAKLFPNMKSIANMILK